MPRSFIELHAGFLGAPSKRLPARSAALSMYMASISPVLDLSSLFASSDDSRPTSPLLTPRLFSEWHADDGEFWLSPARCSAGTPEPSCTRTTPRWFSSRRHGGWGTHRDCSHHHLHGHRHRAWPHEALRPECLGQEACSGGLYVIRVPLSRAKLTWRDGNRRWLPLLRKTIWQARAWDRVLTACRRFHTMPPLASSCS